MNEVLCVENLRVSFDVPNGNLPILNGLELSLTEGHLVGLVGESGSGKSVAASAILGYVMKPGKIDSGKVIINGNVDLLQLEKNELNKWRGSHIALIAANARGRLNPLVNVGQQIANVFSAHNKCSKKDAWRKAISMLKAVGINDPDDRAKAYPHELSGGMAQRCMIAMALVNSPKLLIADDATNGLDVTVQAQIMDLILQMIEERNMSGVFITHDLGVVAQCCNEIAIMYRGQIVEFSPVQEFFENPAHPYSKYLINSLPEYRTSLSDVNVTKEYENALVNELGCLYKNKCRHAFSECEISEPPAYYINQKHYSRCFLFNNKDCERISK